MGNSAPCCPPTYNDNEDNKHSRHKKKKNQKKKEDDNQYEEYRDSIMNVAGDYQKEIDQKADMQLQDSLDQYKIPGLIVADKSMEADRS